MINKIMKYKVKVKKNKIKKKLLKFKMNKIMIYNTLLQQQQKVQQVMDT